MKWPPPWNRVAKAAIAEGIVETGTKIVRGVDAVAPAEVAVATAADVASEAAAVTEIDTV